MKRFRAVPIVTLILAVAAVLIMPQADLPDTVVNSAKVQITSLVHGMAGSLVTVKTFARLSLETLSPAGSRTLQETSEHRYTDVHSVLIQIHTLRC